MNRFHMRALLVVSFVCGVFSLSIWLSVQAVEWMLPLRAADPETSLPHSEYRVLLLRGREHVRSGNFAGAEMDFSRAIEHSPEGARKDLVLSEYMLQLRAAGEKERWQRLSRQLGEERSADVRYLEAFLLVRAAELEPHGDEALRYATKACELSDRKVRKFREVLALALAPLGKFAEAVAEQEAASVLGWSARGDKYFNDAASAARLNLYRGKECPRKQFFFTKEDSP